MKGYQRSLLIDESPLQVIPGLAVAIGLNEAVFLQQIHYWSRISEHEREGRRWVPMTVEELAQKFPFLSESTIKRVVQSLREAKLLIVSKKSITSWERANWYAVDYEHLNHLNLDLSASAQNDTMQRAKLTRSKGSDRADQSGQIDLVPNNSKKTTKKVAGGASPTPVALAFKAYQAGLKKLNGADYPPSAKANGQLSQVVARVGGANVVAVVQFYLASSNPYYRKRRFPLDVLVKDCEQLYMDIQRASGGGGSGQVLDAKPVVRLMCADETVARDLGEFPLGSPIDVAKKVFGSYRGMIARLVSGGSKLRYLDVMLGQARHRFSLAELEADPHA